MADDQNMADLRAKNESTSRQYHCYYCDFSSDKSNIFTKHLCEHHTNERLSVRVSRLCEKTGVFALKSKHFDCPVQVLLSPDTYLDYNTWKLRKRKRKPDLEENDLSAVHPINKNDEAENNGEPNGWKEITDLIPDVMNVLSGTGREKDFGAILSAIAKGNISGNVSLHLLLDLGQYLRQSTVHSMRYSETSINFWLAVQKLFKGKGLRYFGGGKEGTSQSDGQQQPGDNVTGFIVPSQAVLTKASMKYKVDAEKPGVMKEALEYFASLHSTPLDIKLSFDGKKITLGYGRKLGEEDLGGFEQSPTLRERESNALRMNSVLFHLYLKLLPTAVFQMALQVIFKPS